MEVKDIVEMNSHDKQTIYEAYSIEAALRKDLNKKLNLERRATAQMRFQSDSWRDAWLEQDIRNNVEVEGDMEEALELFFSHSGRFTVFTESLGYFAGYEEEDHVFILFANYNHKEWKKELKDMKELIYSMSSFGKPIMWTGTFNVLRNHSIEIEKGLWQLKL